MNVRSSGLLGLLLLGRYLIPTVNAYEASLFRIEELDLMAKSQVQQALESSFKTNGTFEKELDKIKELNPNNKGRILKKINQGVKDYLKESDFKKIQQNVDQKMMKKFSEKMTPDLERFLKGEGAKALSKIKVEIEKANMNSYKNNQQVIENSIKDLKAIFDEFKAKYGDQKKEGQK